MLMVFIQIDRIIGLMIQVEVLCMWNTGLRIAEIYDSMDKFNLNATMLASRIDQYADWCRNCLTANMPNILHNDHFK